MLKIRLERVKGLSFTGYIECSEMSPAQLAELHITDDRSSVEVCGDFNVYGEMDDGQIDDISVCAFNDIHTLDLDENNADIDDLCEQILDTDIGQQLLEKAMDAAESYCEGDR